MTDALCSNYKRGQNFFSQPSINFYSVYWKLPSFFLKWKEIVPHYIDFKIKN